jgi:drug/metabolite transporter (DMT)-like permease
MLQLIIVSFIWAFSFGLIKRHLVGVDSTFVSAVRLGLSLLVFLPFLRLRGVTLRLALILASIGAVQFGLMYLAYIESFRYLRAYEAALFTITTPILVTLIADALDRRLRLRAFAAAVLAVVGAGFVTLKSVNLDLTLTGLVLVQLSNAAFAIGQIAYRRVRAHHAGVRDGDVFALLYAGAFAIALAALMMKGAPSSFSTSQLLTLLYLGVLASGVGFFLWNVGATRVSSGTLAVMNNAKVPLGVGCSLLFFGEHAHYPSLLASLAVMGAAVWLARDP